MTNQPPDYAALRAVCEEAIRANETESESLVVHIPEKRHTITMKPELVLALLDDNERLRTAIREALEKLSWHDNSVSKRKIMSILRTALGEGEKHE